MSSLPPERITIKRRREDEPVNSLYIQRENQNKKVRLISCIFHRSRDDDTFQKNSPREPSTDYRTFRTSSTPNHGPQVPTVRATQPGEEFEGSFSTVVHAQADLERDEYPRGPVGSNGNNSLAFGTRNLNSEIENPRPPAEPRRFHLAKPTSKLPLSDGVFGRTIQKHKRSGRDCLAVFIENRGKIRSTASQAKTVPANSTYQTCEQQKLRSVTARATSASRKRPNAGAIEKQWRAKTWNQPKSPQSRGQSRVADDHGVDVPPDRWNFDSLELATQLHQIALQETRRAEPNGDLVRHEEENPGVTKIEVQDSVSNSSDQDNDDDYVYDTFIRHVARPSEPHSSRSQNYVDPLKSDGLGSLGVLVISEEDEEIWEHYVEDEEDGKDWNSDEEDENAEDFHGNDYPETELDSDDEHGFGAYNYRYRASDDEEYEGSVGTWSDEEDDKIHLQSPNILIDRTNNVDESHLFG